MIALLLAWLFALQSPSAPLPAAQQPAVPALQRWRDALELDLPAEALREMRTSLAKDGALHASGEARYLGAQLAARSGASELIQLALDPAGLAADQQPWLALARARLALERDAFEECARALGLEAGGALPGAIAALPDSQLLLGKLLDRQGQYAAARAPLERFVRESPLSVEAPSAWHALARGAREAGDAARARACALSAQKSAQWQAYYRARRIQLRESPDDPLPRLGIAQLMIAVGKDEAARPWLEETTRRWPAEPRGWLELARLELRAGSDERARALHKRYLEAGGKEPLVPSADASQEPR